MINLEVAQVNVLSKVDLLPEDAPFRLEFFEELPNLKHLADLLDVCPIFPFLLWTKHPFQDHPALAKYKKLNQELCEVVESYGLVGFIALDVNDKERMDQLLRAADSANGFSLATEDDLRNLVMKWADNEQTRISPIFHELPFTCAPALTHFPFLASKK